VLFEKKKNASREINNWPGATTPVPLSTFLYTHKNKKRHRSLNRILIKTICYENQDLIYVIGKKRQKIMGK
jgi:hypothetical protein